MRLLFELSGEHPSLPAAEAEAIAGLVEPDFTRLASEPGVLALEIPGTKEFPGERLAYTHAIHRYLFSCPPEALEHMFAALRLGEGSVCVRVKGIGDRRPDLAKPDLERRLGAVLRARHRIDLGRPDVRIRVLVSEKAYAGVTVYEQEKSGLEQRKPMKRPFFSPVSLPPKLARAMVNLARVGPQARVMDPFCGTGGILIEAGLMGLRVIGSDLEWGMVEGCQRNLEHFGIQDHEVHRADVGEAACLAGEKRVDAVVTDAPYGRASGTRGEKVAGIYARLFRTAGSLLGPGRMLVVAVHDPALIPVLGDFRIVQRFECRVHRSLTRNLMVFEKK